VSNESQRLALLRGSRRDIGARGCLAACDIPDHIEADDEAERGAPGTRADGSKHQSRQLTAALRSNYATTAPSDGSSAPPWRCPQWPLRDAGDGYAQDFVRAPSLGSQLSVAAMQDVAAQM
jgi:hypothetical protein